MSHEEAWFTIMTEYSKNINQVMAGLSQVFAQIIKVFFDADGHNFQTSGVLLQCPGGYSIRLWAKLGGILQDGGAHKAVWHSKGDGATMFCLKCLNLAETELRLCEEYGTNLLVCNVVKSADLIPTTSHAIRRKAKYLETKALTVKGDAFTALQQALGMTHHPRSILLDRALDEFVDPIEIFIHDWMHGLFVGGVWNITLYLFLEVLIKAGKTAIYTAFASFIAGWKWPGRIHGDHLHEIFEGQRQDKHRAAKQIKAQASDMLSIVGVTKLFIFNVVMKLNLDLDCQPHCNALLALIRLIELIVALPRVTSITPPMLRTSAEAFLEKFATAWGFEWMTPKFHWLLHFYKQRMLNCFVWSVSIEPPRDMLVI